MTDDPSYWYHAASCLDTAKRELDDAAATLRDLARGEYFKAIADAKDAIDRAEDAIGARHA